jgi:RNA polymerase sigma-70 factor (ECF subfamily)
MVSQPVERLFSSMLDLLCFSIAFTIKWAWWLSAPPGRMACQFLPWCDLFWLASAESRGLCPVALSEIDRNLLERCLERKSRAWEDFVDRFLGLVIHVVQHTAQARSVRLAPEDRDDLCAEVLLNIIKDDFAILRHFRGQSSLATYLTVVARRIVLKKMMQRRPAPSLGEGAAGRASRQRPDAQPSPEQRISDREEVERLLEVLGDGESQIVRMYHLEGKSYHEISEALGVSENSIGPILSRARSKMRRAGVNQPAG